ncbi:MAG: HPF/RaiA family ribosome-associated protein [Saprospiraceae bacterium]
MIIQFNTDKNITGSEKLEAYVDALISDELSRFSDHITRVEVHLTDENGDKPGQKDKRCVLEVRLEKRQPIAVTSHANTIEGAVSDALEKLKAILETIDGKLKNH